MKAPNVKLSSGQTIPQIALGLWKISDSQEFGTSFDTAIKAGYRHFDSAQAYHNEDLLGQAWQKSGLKREEIFITTKIAVENFGRHKSAKSFKTSLQKLQSAYVDLLLLHFPVPLLRKGTWHVLEDIHASGQAKSIGVSNYTIRHLQEMETYANVQPSINQVELHVFLQQPELIEYCQDKGIVVEAYAPLARASAMDNPAITSIAKKHGKTYAQIMLRWCIQRGLVVLPKSVTPSRIQENIKIFDFELDDQDMAAIAAINQNLRTCWNPTHVP